MAQIAVAGVVYRLIAGQAPVAEIVLFHRRGDTSPVVRNSVTRART